MKRTLLIVAGYALPALLFAASVMAQIGCGPTTRGCMCATVTQHNGKTFHGCECRVCTCNPHKKCCNICPCDNKSNGQPLTTEDVERIRKLIEDKK